MTVRKLLMAAALAIAAWLAFFGDKTPAAGIAEPVARASATAMVPTRPVQQSTSVSGAKAQSVPAILVLQPREALIGGARASKAAEELFGSQTWTPPPPPSKPAPPTTPTAPPLPFTYLGKKVEDGIWEVYLARGDQTIIVREQAVIDGAYRVESIKPPTLAFTYLPLNQVQILTIGGTD